MQNLKRSPDAESEAVGDDAGDALGQVSEQLLDVSELRRRRQRRRRDRRLLALGDTCEQEQQQQKCEDDMWTPQLQEPATARCLADGPPTHDTYSDLERMNTFFKKKCQL